MCVWRAWRWLRRLCIPDIGSVASCTPSSPASGSTRTQEQTWSGLRVGTVRSRVHPCFERSLQSAILAVAMLHYT